MDVYAKLNEVLRAMKARSAGGGDKSGRYKKPDTARRSFIKTRGLPGAPTISDCLIVSISDCLTVSISDCLTVSRFSDCVNL